MLIAILIAALKVMSIPLIILVGESHLNEKKKSILLLLLAFLYNNLLGIVTCFSVIFLSALPNILFIIVMGALIFAYTIIINRYIKRKIGINTTLYIGLCTVAFLIGVLLK